MRKSFSVTPVSPSSSFDLRAAQNGIALLQARGLTTHEHKPSRDCELSYLNGQDDERLHELESAFKRTDCDLVWQTRGGYGLTRILPSLKLPETLLPIFVGFSDASALLLHLWRYRRAKGVHGPMLVTLDKEDPVSLQSLWNILEGRSRETPWPVLEKLWWPTSVKLLEGELIPTNLCVLTHLIGTASMPDLSGAILVLEEVAERPYRIDRMLTQLYQSGSLRGVKAIILGDFTACQEPGQSSLTPQATIISRCKDFGIPLCSGLPVGHRHPNWAIPFGVRARLANSHQAKLEILEEIF